MLTTLLTASCGDKKSPTGPSSNAVQVLTIAPNSGTTLGGTVVAITGAKFAAGATVTIGGVPATNVTVQSDASISATTPQHASGSSDVVVTVGTQTGTLHGGFTFSAPTQDVNQPPTIVSISAKGTRRNEPSGFADLDDQLNINANVTDPETPVSQLQFVWTAATGSFGGTGTSITWTAPHDAPTPLDVAMSLTVVESYQTTDDAGLPVTRENRTTQNFTISLHNSKKEVGDMARQFLLDFSDSSVPTSTVMRNFTDSCRGTSDETGQVQNNRANYNIYYSSVGSPTTTIGFGGNCPFRGRGPVDACSELDVEWKSTVKSSGAKQDVLGTDQVTAVFQGGRWWLCDSDFDGHGAFSSRFIK
jgi:hypothetical protein